MKTDCYTSILAPSETWNSFSSSPNPSGASPKELNQLITILTSVFSKTDWIVTAGGVGTNNLLISKPNMILFCIIC